MKLIETKPIVGDGTGHCEACGKEVILNSDMPHCFMCLIHLAECRRTGVLFVWKEEAL